MILYFSLWIFSVRIKDFVEKKRDLWIKIRVFVVFDTDNEIFIKS